MRFCPSCGSQIPTDAGYCTNCGAAISGGAPPPPPGEGPLQVGASPPLRPPPASGRKGLSRGAKVAIIASSVVIVLVIVFVVLFAVILVGVLSKPADVANGYMEALKKGELDKAWAYLSDEARSEETRASFENKVSDLEGEIESYNTGEIKVSNGRARVVMDISLKNAEKGSWDMLLVEDDGEWKIRGVTTVDN
jgi:hypothetical protein